MPKLSKMRRWSNSRSERVFKERSQKMVSDLIDKSYSYLLETNEALQPSDRDAMAMDIAEVICAEYLSEDFFELARTFDPEVDPKTVDNTQDLIEAMRDVTAR